ncbi:hypothetical protein KKE07_05125 [Candidatus Dependentiae bacterium]|nr:hypothetical protein [Candidatus Dependentiae bacterium]
MNAEVLIQNVFNLFIVAIIIEASVMAVFTMAVFKHLRVPAPAEMARDFLILLLAFILCYKVDILTLFKGTGIKVPYIIDTIISALVLTRLTNFVREFFARIKISD